MVPGGVGHRALLVIEEAIDSEALDARAFFEFGAARFEGVRPMSVPPSLSNSIAAHDLKQRRLAGAGRALNHGETLTAAHRPHGVHLARVEPRLSGNSRLDDLVGDGTERPQAQLLGRLERARLSLMKDLAGREALLVAVAA